MKTIKKMSKGGSLKDVPAGKVGLGKLPTEVRNKMGYKKYGGATATKKKMGGAVPKGSHKMPDGRIMKDSAHKSSKKK